jgi:hypothetical protein
VSPFRIPQHRPTRTDAVSLLPAVAESFSLTPSSDPPPLFTVPLGAPRDMKKPDWAPAPSFTRPIAITASICLDFAHPALFHALPARPALVLGPARTWHTAVSRAMWEQARTRAHEVGSMLLWCDGGEGGVSGVAGSGGTLRDVIRVGPGSWVRTVGVEWPFDEQRTAYARIGSDLAVLALLAAVAGAATPAPALTRVWRGIRDWRQRRRSIAPLLL